MSHELRERVRQGYARTALNVIENSSQASCCGPDCCGDAATSLLYEPSETKELPDAAVLASLGCGSPTSVAELRTGDVVLDLGSGGGIDVLLSASSLTA